MSDVNAEQSQATASVAVQERPDPMKVTKTSEASTFSEMAKTSNPPLVGFASSLKNPKKELQDGEKFPPLSRSELIRQGYIKLS